MVATVATNEYLEAVRRNLCSRCIARLPGAPPCENCGVERHLPALIEICRLTDSRLIDPYKEAMDAGICAVCDLRDSRYCPCPLSYLLSLAVQAIEEVEFTGASASVVPTEGF